MNAMRLSWICLPLSLLIIGGGLIWSSISLEDSKRDHCRSLDFIPVCSEKYPIWSINILVLRSFVEAAWLCERHRFPTYSPTLIIPVETIICNYEQIYGGKGKMNAIRELIMYQRLTKYIASSIEIELYVALCRQGDVTGITYWPKCFRVGADIIQERAVSAVYGVSSSQMRMEIKRPRKLRTSHRF